MTTEDDASSAPAPRSVAWATRSSARRTPGSSVAPASTSTTSTCPASSGWTSCAARTRTRRSSRIDTSEALKVPGVPAVITGKDLEGYKLHWMPTLAGDMQMVLPMDTVMYQSQEVAAVIATSRYAAADGVAAVLVDYEPLPVIVDPHKALEADASVLRPDRGEEKQNNHIWHWESGDGPRPMPRSRRPRSGSRGHLHPAHPRRLDRDLRLRRGLGPGPPAAHPAHDDPGTARHPDRRGARRRRRRPAHLRAEHPGQDPRHRRRLRREGAGLSGLRPGGRRLVPDRQAGQVDRGSLREPPGGSFARDYHIHTEMGATKDGKITGLKVKTIADHGYTDAAADPSKFPAGLFNVITGSYDFQNAFVEVDGVYTNKPPGGVAYRCSFRVTEAVHAIERMVDILAHEIGKDPAQLRMENFIQPEQFPYKTPTGWEYDSGDYGAGAPEGHGHDRLRRAAQGAAREARARRAHGHRHQLVHRDRRCRAVARLRHPGHQDVRLVRDPGPSDGQGPRADRRPDPGPGPRDDLRPDHRRGARLPGGGHQDRGRRHGHRALRPRHVCVALDAGRRRRTAIAARKIRDKARKLAAHLLEASEEDLEWEPGKFSVKGSPDRFKTIQEIAFAAYTNHPAGMEAGLEAVDYYDPPNLTFPFGSLHLRRRHRQGHRPGQHPPLRRDRRLRQHHQPDDRRRADPRRPDDGSRAGAVRGDHVRRARQQHGRDVHGLPRPDRRRDPGLGGRARP